VRAGRAALQSLLARGRDNLGGDLLGVAVLHADHRRLANGTPASIQLIAGVLVLFLPAEVGLVHFVRTGKLPAIL